MRLFSTDSAGQHSQSAAPVFATAEANGSQPLRAVSPWRRSIKATGAFLFCLVTAGGVMFMNNSTRAQSGTSLTSPNSEPSASVSSNTEASASSSQAGTTSASASATVSSADVTMNSTAPSNTDSSASHTTVTVNGQNVAVPKNGTSQQTITDENGTTNVIITNTSTGDASSSSSSSTNTSVNLSGNSFQPRALALRLTHQEEAPIDTYT